ncbi:AfsR/SARP family transcriptional regulator [Micromonospora sp. NBC_01813]|uniref:AfsR/SARP family transcriptional regulator n=1 Tax=Micromonospora sp. NBC_01813 TaxID=2975988 RepID=UPI002DD99E39|nr:AfsR/SARP family transcriptional regulator [Micromonospora sp. NBC_01813]WSA07519.1 AfsR/SARP family transcriptional regulator [Micromonospora sp. NBC_01813]
MDDALRLSILGPVRAWHGDHELSLGPPQQRAVLAVLAAYAGQPAGFDIFADVLWDGSPPPSGPGVVHGYVSRLRRVLAAGRPTARPPGPIERVGAGYRWRGDEQSLDLLRFRKLVEQALDLTAVSRHQLALDTLLEAARLWQGPAAADIDAARTHPLFVGLEREHSAALVELAGLALAGGQAAAVLPVLERGAARDPFNETLQAGLMRVLAANGQRAAGLERYRAVRAGLVTELGVDPGAELQAAHRHILLAGSPPAPLPAAKTAKEAENPSPVDVSSVRPAQLPADSVTFVGRDSELVALAAARRETALPPAGGATSIALVSGMAGVGKSTLAIRWAHQIADEHPDGQLYVNLRGYDASAAPLAPEDALRGFLVAFGLPGADLPDSLADRAALFRSVVAGRRVLIVLDNARDHAQVRPLLPAASGCTVIVTSRNLLGGLVAVDGARPVALTVLTARQAHDYLQDRLGSHRVDAQPQAVQRIVALCAGLPLALAIVAARAATHRTFPLAAIADELQFDSVLDGFSLAGAHYDLSSVFSWSYRSLPVEAARLFRHLALHPGPDVDLAAAASVAAADPATTRTLLLHLIDAHLINEYRPGRFQYHDLLRAYGVELSRQHDAEPERAAAALRVIDHYLHSALGMAPLVYPLRPAIEVADPTPGVLPVRVPDRAAAVAWLDSERENLFASSDAATRHGHDARQWQLVWAINPYLQDVCCLWRESTRHSTRALAAAERLGAQWWVGYLHNTLGRSYLRLEEYPQAEWAFGRAIEIGAVSGDLWRQAHGNVGFAAAIVMSVVGGGETDRPPANQDEERISLAYDCLRRAGEQYRHLDSKSGLASVHSNLGMLAYLRPGGAAEALRQLRAAVELARGVGDHHHQSEMWIDLARLHLWEGEVAAAAGAYGQAIEVLAGLELSWRRAEATAGLAECYRRLGDTEAAEEACRAALRLLGSAHHAPAERLRSRLRRSGRWAGRDPGPDPGLDTDPGAGRGPQPQPQPLGDRVVRAGE